MDLSIRFLFKNSTLFFDPKTIRIWKDQWDLAPEIIKSRLKSRFGLNFTLPARVCKVKRITKLVSDDFLNLNHLQKSTGAKLKYGLFLPNKYFRLLKNDFQFIDNEEEILVAVMTFSAAKKYYFGTEIVNSFELVRFGTLPYFNIVGGFSKLMRFFVNEKKPGNIMTYVDADWSDGQNFLKMGFKFIESTGPVFYKMGNNNERIPVAKADDFDVYNSGSLKFIKNGF
ncbi:MAG: hypothetical protein IPP61_20800 [Cytophagaceae bacterium]|nr:hypothetical protein [Cytophagaceae bacterium]MBL0327562.1 hypothetical protein [Cytophagaceae bacterium]